MRGEPTSASLALAMLISATACQPPGQRGGAGAAEDAAAGEAADGPTVAFTDSEVTAGLGLPFSEVARHGDLLFVSGMVGIEPGTTELVEGGFEAEARRALANLGLMLAEVGASPDDVLRCTVMLDDMANFERFNEVYTDFLGDHRPARTTIGVDGLALGAAVEIECVAALPDG